MLNISASKSVHICTFATVTVHICMVIVARAFSILLFFLSPPLSLSLFLSSLTLHLIRVPSLSQRSQQLSKEEVEGNFPTTNSAQPNYHHHNPNLPKTHSKSKPKSIKTKSNRKPIRKIQKKPT